MSSIDVVSTMSYIPIEEMLSCDNYLHGFIAQPYLQLQTTELPANIHYIIKITASSFSTRSELILLW